MRPAKYVVPALHLYCNQPHSLDASATRVYFYGPRQDVEQRIHQRFIALRYCAPCRSRYL